MAGDGIPCKHALDCAARHKEARSGGDAAAAAEAFHRPRSVCASRGRSIIKAGATKRYCFVCVREPAPVDGDLLGIICKRNAAAGQASCMHWLLCSMHWSSCSMWWTLSADLQSGHSWHTTQQSLFLLASSVGCGDVSLVNHVPVSNVYYTSYSEKRQDQFLFFMCL